MAVNGKKKDLLSSRRRREDEGEEDEGLEDLADDSQSEGSILTLDENGAADGSDASEISRSEVARSARTPDTANGVSPERQKKGPVPVATEAPSKGTGTPTFAQSADMEAMTSGLRTRDQKTGDEEALDFEDSAPSQRVSHQPAASTTDALEVQPLKGSGTRTNTASQKVTGGPVNGSNKRAPPTGPAALQNNPTASSLGGLQIPQAGRGRGRDRQGGALAFNPVR